MLYSVAPFKVVTPFDPAIDDEKSNVAMYAQTRDLKYLTFLPGQQPTYFYVRRLPNSKALAIRQHATSEDFAAGMAFAAGVVQVDNLRTEGGTIPTWKPSFLASDGKIDQMTQEEIDSVNFALDEIIDIGSVVYQRANLRVGRPVYYALPQLSVEGLAKKTLSSRPAEPPSLPREAPSEPSKPQAQQSNCDGDKPTAATVTDQYLNQTSPSD